MQRLDWRPLLEHALAIAARFLDTLPERPIAPRADAAAMLALLSRSVPDEPCEPAAVIDELAASVDRGLAAMPSGRFFGFVVGGTLPAALAADWLTSVWDQNAVSSEATPAAAAIDHVALRWVAELLDLPIGSGALVTGAQMANFVGLAIARDELSRAAGWDIARDGLGGAPPIDVIAGAERHVTIDRALRLLGIGSRSIRIAEADAAGRMRAERMDLAGDGPLIVCAQAGNVNGGAFDPLVAIHERIVEARTRRPVWLHVDGAFGLWVRASARHRELAAGAELADSWATDAHKWLNTPYDCGIALARDAAAHRRTFHGGAAYVPGDVAVPNPFDHTPELSRRARGFALWAALRQLGRRGVAELVDRSCAQAARFARELAQIPEVEVMNDVVSNQIVVRVRDASGGDARTRAVLAWLHADGTCYPTATTWRGAAAIRISISNWSTDDHDIDASVAAVRRALT